MSAGTGAGGRFTRAGFVICSACQAENRATNRFCERCGTRIGVSTRSPVRKPEVPAAVQPPSSGTVASASPATAADHAPGPIAVPDGGIPMHDAAPSLIDLAPLSSPGASGAVKEATSAGALGSPTVAPPRDHATGAPAVTAPSMTSTGTPPVARAEVVSLPAGPASASRPSAGRSGAATPYSTADGNHTRTIALGIVGGLLSLCVVLWVLLVFLGAINFTARGAAFATSVATIVATRAP